jgi:ribosomal subunit interface protein
MQLSITGKQVDLGEGFRGHVVSSLDAILDKYFKTAVEAHVVVTPEAHLFRTELSLHVGRGIVANAGAAAADVGAAFDAAAERLAKRLRRYKRRLRAHHAKPREAAETGERARTYVLASSDGEAGEEPDENGGWPAVVAEIVTELPTLSVGEAVMRLDLADAPVLLFRNHARGELNLVYRRQDGNIGWIEPELAPVLRADGQRA